MAQTMRFFGGRGGRVFGKPPGPGNVLPAGAAGFFKRRLAEIMGVTLFAAAAWLLVSYVSFSPGDPSLNSAGGGGVANLMGPAGAMAADLMLQFFGIAGLLPVLVFMAW